MAGVPAKVHNLFPAGTCNALWRLERSSARKLNMTTSSAASQAQLKTIRAKAHPSCVVCSPSNPAGLGLEFTVQDDGSVCARFAGHAGLEGFEGFLHGGIIATLLDAAMTNCLFAHGLVAMTAELSVRYRKPVLSGQALILRARITHSRPPLHLLAAELEQEDCIRAIASAKFLQCDARDGPSQDADRE